MSYPLAEEILTLTAEKFPQALSIVLRAEGSWIWRNQYRNIQVHQPAGFFLCIGLGMGYRTFRSQTMHGLLELVRESSPEKITG